MATITRTEDMFVSSAQTVAPASFWNSLQRAVSRMLVPSWVIQFAEEKAEEINRQHFYYC